MLDASDCFWGLAGAFNIPSFVFGCQGPTYEELLILVQGLLGSEIVGAQSENVVINGLPYSSQAASFVTRSGLQVCCALMMTLT